MKCNLYCIIFVLDRPDPPTGKPQISEITKESVRLTWQVPAHDGGALITSYLIEKRECHNANTNWIICGSTHLTTLIGSTNTGSLADPGGGGGCKGHAPSLFCKNVMKRLAAECGGLYFMFLCEIRLFLKLK